MNVSLSKLSSLLTGKATGRKHYAKICGMLAKARNGEVVFLDFEDVETVTGSWLNMAISPVFRWAAESQNDLFPVLTHFPSAALDELELVAEVNQQCYPVADVKADELRKVLLVGPLDEALKEAMVKLAELHEATGAEMARQVPDAGIQATGWNNRLRDLYEKRLLLRRKQGRQQIYSPVADEVVLHQT